MVLSKQRILRNGKTSMNTCRSGSIVKPIKLSLVLVAFALLECCAQAAEFTPNLGVLEILADTAQQ